jgi:superoxide dismutase, Fe-Mn family
MAITLPALPYDKAALAPHISAETLEFHHGKHHNAYVTNLNKLLDGSPLAEKSLEEIILASDGGIFNNAAQVWNHTFYWNSMKPNGGGAPTGDLAAAIDRDFGSFDKFKEAFTAAATTQFGSGWAWLVVENGKLAVTKTANADLPLKHGQTALLTLDVWEHAYYIDYRNLRPKYIETFLTSLANWDFAAANLAAAKLSASRNDAAKPPTTAAGGFFVAVVRSVTAGNQSANSPSGRPAGPPAPAYRAPSCRCRSGSPQATGTDRSWRARSGWVRSAPGRRNRCRC